MPSQSGRQTPIPLGRIAKEWGKIGITGFGGPPTHIAMFRSLCVEREVWVDEVSFEHAISAVNLLPGPASTQLAIYLAWKLRRTPGALIGGICFILPGLVLILLLASLFLMHHPPRPILGLAAGAGAAVPAVALQASWHMVPGSWKRMGSRRSHRARWLIYVVLGATVSALIGEWLVLFLLGCGLIEIGMSTKPDRTNKLLSFPALPLFGLILLGGTSALAWVSLKVGALSYGGGFVIIPLMQHDAVTTYHWMSNAQFLNAVALGQITPGPVVQTVAVVGYAASGLLGGLFAALIAFAPSFLFVIFGASSFERLRENAKLQSFLTGAGAACLGAIGGASLPLALALAHLWQVGVLAVALTLVFIFRRSALFTIISAGLLGLVAAVLHFVL